MIQLTTKTKDNLLCPSEFFKFLKFYGGQVTKGV